MAIKAKFTPGDIKKEIERQRLKIINEMAELCRYAGEEFVKNARDGLSIDSGLFPKGDYQDRTKHLRNSIGYAVVVNGTIRYANSPKNSEGASFLVDQISSLKKVDGILLIGVAGKDYASHVEAMGYNVITSQAEVALVDLNDLLQKYTKRKFK